MKKIFISVLGIGLILLFTFTASSHSGKTDSNGGHYDSSAGEYHYHHGYPAHDHYDTDGDGDLDCPFDFKSEPAHDNTDTSNAPPDQTFLYILIWIFLGINLLIRVPIRIAIRFFKIQNDALLTADLISTLAALACFLGMCITALILGVVNTALAIACIVLFGGIYLLLSGAWIYAIIKEKKKKKKTNNQTKEYIMKVLIWIGCFFSVAVIQMIVSDFGIILGGIPTALLFGAAWFVAKKLCDKWDMHNIEKKAAEANMTVSEYAKQGLSEDFLAKVEHVFNTLPYERAKDKLKECVKKKKITKDQYIILLREYSKTK